METNQTDLTFFTNEAGHTLLDRFKSTLKDTQLFDVLVGYFRASGFYQLSDSLQPIDKTRILVGLGVDGDSYRAINEYHSQTVLDFESHNRTKKQFQDNLINEIENNEEADEQLEKGLKQFIEFLQRDCSDMEQDKDRGGNGKKLQLRAYPSKNIHAKVYIGRFQPDDRDFGFVITGSSNFSYSGLVANREFNVELRQRGDVEFALEQFETLWKDSVEISSEFVDAIEQKTFLRKIPPYELYLKLIYEYLQEDINPRHRINPYLPDGFMKLQYQQQAVIQALKKLEEFNGVFLADVVGLGKTFIAAQLLQQVQGRVLVICPPVLQEYWKESLLEFNVSAHVESLGKLETIIQKGLNYFDYIVVDEAHRFRNESTQSYADLLDICRGKKVILVTATPLNNKIDDIFAQLKLFQAPRKSTIPGIPNLEKFFNRLHKRFAKLRKGGSEYTQVVSEVSGEIREKILKHVMVRRTRTDVIRYFKNDTESQGLVFPEMQEPQKIAYQFEGRVETTFDATMALFQEFRYTRYISLLYYTGSRKLTEFEKQQQRNIGGFMKGLLVKRLESSFYAFKKSVGRFVASYEQFIEMFKNGTVYISKKVNVYDLLDNDDLDKLEKYVEEEKAQRYDAKDFKKSFLPDLEHDLAILKEIDALWQDIDEDPKLEQLLLELQTNKTLKKKKLVLFTESKETGEHLYNKLIRELPKQVLFYSSQGGRCWLHEKPCNHRIARDLITSNYDPNNKIQTDDLRILITTDILSEGINLHRANIIINYDLPWNPTRVLQRTGRINRLGTSHSKIFIFNFFPTSQADAHLGLEKNITHKIQMFHSILGEDAKYLTEGEEIGSQKLFDTLNRKNSYTGEGEEGDSELKYLEIMRTLRDEQPDLFQKIKELPKKARSGFKQEEGIGSDQLVTFFRLGKLKKFYQNESGHSREITFFDAVKLLDCEPETKRAEIPPDYFSLLETNRHCFSMGSNQDADMTQATAGGRSNIAYIEKRLKEKGFKRCPIFTDNDEEFLAGVREMIAQGTIAKKIAQKVKKGIESIDDPLEILAVLRKHIRTVSVVEKSSSRAVLKKEVILSGYLVGGGRA